MHYRQTSMIALVFAGGYGRRILEVSERYGCKSLIPVNGQPLLSYVLASLMSVHRGPIIICVDREDLLPVFRSFLAGYRNCQLSLFHDSGPGSTVAIVREVAERFGPVPMCVTYGHHPIPPKHFRQMLALESTTLGLSVYKTSSDWTRKVVLSEGSRIIGIRRVCGESFDENNLYADVPYVFPEKLVESVMTEKVDSVQTISNWITNGSPVRSFQVQFPHEFHGADELHSVRAYVESQKRLIYGGV